MKVFLKEKENVFLEKKTKKGKLFICFTSGNLKKKTLRKKQKNVFHPYQKKKLYGFFWVERKKGKTKGF